VGTRTIDDLLVAAGARLDRLDPATARDEIASGAVLIDTRRSEARRTRGVIPGSVHIPLLRGRKGELVKIGRDAREQLTLGHSAPPSRRPG